MARRTPAPELPILHVEDGESWESWLALNADSSPGVWLRLARKNSGLAAVSYAEALEAALCYGWIDSQKKSYDDRSSIQRFTPRGPRSIWSKINRAKAIRLIDEGRMAPAGLKAIEAAKADGRWDNAYDGARTATVPEDLALALEKDPAARATFEALNSANRYAVLFRIQTARKPETRARWIEKLVGMLSRGELLHP